ncbi:ABC transporter permease [Halosolutus gelatinilyticus]|uniref:ABC transporter permease n=1 Tax=Halosolutus gelatinilyticus TaxID=2931975 RepID=UPI001FF57A01|nr:ABC transporter permease [Halosolutus gelatinilyticus]
MKRSEKDTSTDGGSVAPQQSLFETTADVERSRAERYRALIDEYVFAPGRIIWKDWRARIGITITTLFVLIGTVGVELVDRPYAGAGPELVGPFDSAYMTVIFGIPFWEYPLGTDSLGRGVFAQIVHATPAMLEMMFAGAIFSIVLSVVWGLLSGYKGGSVDQVMMAIADIVMTLPALPLVVVLAAILQPTEPWVIGIILVVNRWASFARSLRSEVLKLRHEPYVEASRTIGISTPAIITKDVLPNVMPLIVVNFVSTARNVIMASVGLYFLGLLPNTGFNWGVMMDNAYGQGAIYTKSLFHWFYPPMITIIFLSLGLLLLGQGLDRIFNPRIRARHAEHTRSDDESDAKQDEDVTVPDVQGGI